MDNSNMWIEKKKRFDTFKRNEKKQRGASFDAFMQSLKENFYKKIKFKRHQNKLKV